MIKALTIEEMAQLPCIEKLGDLKNLSMFYVHADDQVILNSSHENYEIYNMLAASYLTADCDKRERLKAKIQSRFPEEIDLLEKVIQIRLKKELNNPERIKKQYKKEFKMIGNQTAFWKHLDFIDAIEAVEKKSIFALTYAFNWGYIQGIKAERARRKKCRDD